MRNKSKCIYVILIALIISCSISTSVIGAKNTKPRIVLCGSSSIRMWGKRANKLFDSYKVLNKAIGNTKVTDWLFLYKKRVIKYRPDVVVFYCGANDIQDGHGTSGIYNAENTKELLLSIRRHLKWTRIFYISINHCNRNTTAWGEIDTSNEIMRDFCESHANMYYIDIVQEHLLPDDTPNPIFFRNDKLHPSKKGLEIWDRVVGGYINTVLG